MALTPSSSIKTFRLRTNRRPSKNGWKAVSSLVFSKSAITHEEIIWLETFTPGATLETKEVPHARFTPSYKIGAWDGLATYVTFKDRSEALLFKLTWWNFTP